MQVNFDIISDLNLSSGDLFDWTNKPTSLYCIVAGNVSTDIYTIRRVLMHLSGLYHGVFYIDGAKDHTDLPHRDRRVDEIQQVCTSLKNVIYLHNNVVIVDGVGLVGVNGWYNNIITTSNLVDDFQSKCYRFEDIGYLEKTIERLQLHVDVKKIVVISNSVPLDSLFFGEKIGEQELQPGQILHKDTEAKITHWVYGSYNKIVDTVIDNINYICNSKSDRNPYYAKRIEVII
jgi:hypothetical protein